MSALTDHDRIAVMAYADGELTPEDIVAFDARLATEPALAAALARERTLRATLLQAYAPALAEPVPAGLLDLLALPETAAANDPVQPQANDAHRAALPHARRWRWLEWGAMAASVVLGVVVGGRVLAPPPASGLGGNTVALAVGGDGAITAQGALRDALEQRVGGTVLDPNSRVGVGLTFRNHDQQFCRSFTLDNASAGIACKQADGWVVANLERAPAATAASAGGSFRMASSPYSPALLQAIDAMRDGDTLDAAAERAARDKAWQR